MNFRFAVCMLWIVGCLIAAEASAQYKVQPPKKRPPIDQVFPPPPLASLTVSHTSVTGGASIVGTVTLSSAVLGVNANISLSSGNPAVVTVPATVTVQNGRNAATFPITTKGVAAAALVTLTASDSTKALNASITVHRAVLEIVSGNTPALGGRPVSVSVSLSGMAPPSGAIVTLSCGPILRCPGYLKILEGSSTALAAVDSLPVGSPTSVTISGSYGGVSKSAQVQIEPPWVTVQLTPSTVQGGTAVTGRLTLNVPAPAEGWSVYLTSDKAAVTVPGTVSFAGGATSSATFPISTTPVLQQVAAKIAVWRSGDYSPPFSSTLTVLASTLQTFAIQPPTANFQTGTVDGVITFSGPAPPNVSVPLSWTSSEGAVAPSTVPVPAGASSVTFKITLKPVTAPTPFSLSALHGGVRKTATLTVNP